MKYIDRLVDYCVKSSYISNDKAPWLRYALEKHLSTIVVIIPFMVLGLCIATPYVVFPFYISYFALRKRINGIHAKTLWGCFCISIMSEFIFLGIVGPLLNTTWMIVLLIISSATIYFLAPFNHPNMHLDDNEISACSKDAKWRLLVLLILIALSFILRLTQLAHGFTLGIMLAAIMLVLAYIQNIGGLQNERKQFQS